jgi:SAM-dependent methyltransferase
MNEGLFGVREWLHSLIRPASSVLDIGCGDGEDLAMLAAAMPDGSVFIGMDSRKDALPDPREDSRIQFLCASAEDALPFEDRSFDLVYSVNMLECIADKSGFLHECHRVLKPSGQVLIAHWDWDTLTFDGSEREPVRHLVHTFNDWKQAWMADIDPWMGRRLWRVIGSTKLFTGEIRCHTMVETHLLPGTYARQQVESFAALVRRGMFGDAPYQAFLKEQEDLQREREFFFSLTMFAYLGYPA